MKQSTRGQRLHQAPAVRDPGRPGRAGVLAGVLLWAIVLAGPALAQLQVPEPVGYVNDFAEVIDPEREAQIERVIEEVRAKSGGEIVVVTLPSLEGRPRDEVALDIFRAWGIGAGGEPGDPNRDTGTLLLVAPTERESRIMVGYGANTFITAAETGRIQDDYMIPAFREGDFGTGILHGVTALAGEYAERYGFELTGEVPELPEPRAGGGGDGSVRLLVFIALIILFLVLSNRGGRGGGGRGGRRRRGGGGIVILPGGFGGGGFGGGGFGGGGFGGGGFGGFGGGGTGGGGVGRGW